MSTSLRWALIAFVALCTSFTTWYALFNPEFAGGNRIYMGTGILLYAGCVFVSMYLTKKRSENPIDYKGILQAGLRTAIIALVVYSIYHYLYLRYINPEIIDSLIANRIESIKFLGLPEAEESQRIADVEAQITPFKKVNLDLLRLLFIGSLSSFFGAFIVHKF